jgi:hypothetical protein
MINKILPGPVARGFIRRRESICACAAFGSRSRDLKPAHPPRSTASREIALRSFRLHAHSHHARTIQWAAYPAKSP